VKYLGKTFSVAMPVHVDRWPLPRPGPFVRDGGNCRACGAYASNDGRAAHVHREDSHRPRKRICFGTSAT